MKHKETHIVTENNGPRPAGEIDKCFYCHEPLGSNHKDDCVLKERTVVLDVRLEVAVAVPAFWDENMITFHRNGSSFCKSNIIADLQRANGENGAGCLCSAGTIEYLREATAEDDVYYGLTLLQSDEKPTKGKDDTHG